MKALIHKDFSQFFLNGSGIVILCLFLLINSLILWVIPNPYNILEGAYADLNFFFELSPWLFAFLIPAIGQKIMGEEKQSGTLELLKTLPISFENIIASKIISILLLCLLACSPIIVYVFSLLQLGQMDFGVLIGSFSGLILVVLVMSCMSIAIFNQSKNSLVGLIIAVLINCIVYFGFQFIYPSLGLYAHYISISRGVIHLNDIAYFVSISIGLYSITVKTLKWKWLLPFIVLFIFNGSIDLTEDKRYTLKTVSKNISLEITSPLNITNYLGGEFPPEFQRLKTELDEIVGQYQSINKKIRYSSEDPQDQFQALIEKGMEVSSLTVEKNGVFSEQYIVPYLLVEYKDRELVVNLLKDTDASNQIEQSVRSLEYGITDAIYKLTQQKNKKIAVLAGNGQSPDLILYDLLQQLGTQYFLAKFTLDSVQSNPQKTLKELSQYDIIINSNPKEEFTESEKYVLDQYQYQGGNSLWMVDQVSMALDSLMVDGQSLSFPKNLNLNDLFFAYGLRTQSQLIKDFYSSEIPMATGQIGEQTQYQLIKWPYNILSKGNEKSPISTNLGYVNLEFSNPIEFLKSPLTQTPLLFSSPQSMAQNAPSLISLEQLLNEDSKTFKGGPYINALMIEGQFPSSYEHRTKPFENNKMINKNSKLIYVADGNIGENKIDDGQPLPLGYLPWSDQVFDNKNFLLNCIDFLAGQEDLLVLRTKKVDLFPLDQQKAYEQGNYFRILNTIVPIVIFILLNFSYRKYYKKVYQ
ncbi:gliding motility-associated ABC transporter substrate-binding protein GldG [Flavobacteriaceae bacterium]|nr:gliding motility-associated ABC transporter substrate-binding protein GldG [Flavobacteriaceae bacterium]